MRGSLWGSWKSAVHPPQCLQPLCSVCSSPGLSFQSRTRCSWTTSGWPWRVRLSNRRRFPQTFLSPGWTPPSLLPSFLRWWGVLLLLTQRRTRSWHQPLSLQVPLRIVESPSFFVINSYKLKFKTTCKKNSHWLTLSVERLKIPTLHTSTMIFLTERI